MIAPKLFLLFSLPPNYPCIPPVFEIETNQSQSLSYRDADQLYDLLMMEATNGLGRGVVFGLVSTARDFVAELLERRLKEQGMSKQKDAEQPNEVLVRGLNCITLPSKFQILFFLKWLLIDSCSLLNLIVDQSD